MDPVARRLSRLLGCILSPQYYDIYAVIICIRGLIWVVEFNGLVEMLAVHAKGTKKTPVTILTGAAANSLAVLTKLQ